MSSQNPNTLDTDKIGRLFIKLTTPMLFGNLIQNIYSIVDMIFVGNYVGLDGIAALSIVFPIQSLIFGIGNMIGIGGGSLVSRLIGGREQKSAEKALGNSIFFGITFSIILTAIILPTLNYLLKLIGASDQVLPLASSYLTIVFAATFINVTYSILLMIVRAEGNTRVAMISMTVQSLLNIVFDAIFIIGLRMGVTGAALAAVISQFVALAYLFSYYLAGDSYLKIRWSNLMPDRKIVKGIFAIGVTQFAQTAAMTISAMFFIRQAINYGGDVALGAFGIIQRVMMFASMPSMVLGQAMQPILGFNYGAKRYKMALKSIYLAAEATLACIVVAYLILMIWPEPIVRVFTSDAVLVSESVVAMRYIFSMLPFFSLFNIGQLVFPSIGKVWESFIIAITRPGLFLLALVLTLPHFFQMKGVWLSFPGSDLLGFLLVVALLIPLIIKFKKAAAADVSVPGGH
jgi:putative MATE family efflux protein